MSTAARQASKRTAGARMRPLRLCLLLWVAVLAAAPTKANLALASSMPANAPSKADTPSRAQAAEPKPERVAQNRKRRRRRRRRRRNRRRRQQQKRQKRQRQDTGAKQEQNEADQEKADGEQSGDDGDESQGPVLDLSTLGEEDESAKQEILSGGEAEQTDDTSDSSGAGGGEFDFGGGSKLDGAVDFGGGEEGELEGFDLGEMEVASEQRERFEAAMELMTDQEYAQAALEFRYFVQDEAFEKFHDESEYQLAKALYKLELLHPALKRFRAILEAGASHERYRKSIEWLFFLSRKMADETPVLAELAQFRNVTFPEAYQNEYRYLLGKYLFQQAQQLEVGRLEEAQLKANMQSQAASFDFSQLNQQTAGDDEGGFDFGGAGGGDGGALDFGGEQSSEGFDFGTEGGFDFGESADVAEPDVPFREAAPSTAKEAIQQALDFVGKVGEDSKFYPEAKYLEGLLYYLRGGRENRSDGFKEHQKAIEAFQKVVRLLNPKAGRRLDPELREMAFLSLARIHYGYKQFNRSVYYYDRISRDSQNWLTALFEASWAYYRRGDFEKALGNLLTLHSPFFEREYFPESKIVKAIIYFEACRYEETRDIVDGFLGRYTEVMEEIERIAESEEDPEVLFERIARIRTAGASEDDTAARLVSLALQDPRIRTARQVVQQVENQLELWRGMDDEFTQSRLGGDIKKELEKLAIEKSAAAGEVTQEKFQRELYALKSLLAQALRIKIEVTRAERMAIKRRMQGEADQDALVAATPKIVVDDEHLYWPYEGEYWRDELGTYELDFSMCRRMATQ